MKAALVTGSSRGIGAEVAKLLAADGVSVAINYREKAARAQRLLRQIKATGGSAILAGGDLTVPADIRRILALCVDAFGLLDILVLNASGGLETGRAPDYAYSVNRDAQVQLLEMALPVLRPGARVVYVTSHWAHFYGSLESVPEYEPIAASKHAGEIALRASVNALPASTVSLVVVSGDLIAGTATSLLMEKAHPGLLKAYEAEVGELTTVQSFASVIVEATNGLAGEDGIVCVGPIQHVPVAGSPRNLDQVAVPRGS